MKRESVHEIAKGRWHGILQALCALTERQLSGKHCPCPNCGGTDRFRFDDKEGRGTWYCQNCGPRNGGGSGVDLVMLLKGWDFKTAAKEIEQAAGVIQSMAIRNLADEEKNLEKLYIAWRGSKPLQVGDDAWRYLVGRGLSLAVMPDNLRLHPSMRSCDGGRYEGTFPTMLARVTGPDGESKNIQRTYLHGGKKADVAEPKKLMAGMPMKGGAIRLFPISEVLGIAEGIETALAAAQMYGIPVWSCISANGIRSFEPPAGVKRLVIFADNDANFVGQAAATAAAERLVQRGLDVHVKPPEMLGDWLDVLVAGGPDGDFRDDLRW